MRQDCQNTAIDTLVDPPITLLRPPHSRNYRDTISKSNIGTDRLRGAASPQPAYFSPKVLVGLYGAIEIVGLIALIVRMASDSGPIPVAIAAFCTIVALVLATASTTLGGFTPSQLAKVSSSPLRGMLYTAFSFGFAFLLVAATEGIAEFPSRWFSTTLAWCFAYVGIGRIAASLIVKGLGQRGHFERRLAVVGGGELGQRLIKHLSASPGLGVNLVGFFDDRASRVPDTIDGVPYLGKLGDIADWVRDQRLQTVIVALPWAADARINEIRQRLWLLPLDVRLSPDHVGFSVSAFDFDILGGLPLLGVGSKPISEWALLAKRAEDLALSFTLLLLLAPLFALIALMVKLDSRGPIFFRQKRTGYGGRLIEVIKFRTIKVEHTDANAEKLVSKHDPRVTRFGRFLRRSSLDELPQLFNVLCGDMSMVGPRPHPTAAKAGGCLYPDVVEDYAARHKVRPGITGWAQVNGWRGETDTIEKIQKRVAHDLYYIENWSLWLDLKILLKTVLALASTERAY